MSYIQKSKSYKKIILNTEDAIASVGKATSGTGNSEFSFNKFNTITIKENSYLKIDAISANISTSAVWTVKLDNIMFNQNCYYNSDRDGTPTILTRSFNGKSSLNLDGVSLELPPQDINDFKLIILDESNNGINGAKISLEFCIEEIDN
tara:strand:+ start:319 stop:765 length:447 start_codon:yes stop_codon:yes gene_type:complete